MIWVLFVELKSFQQMSNKPPILQTLHCQLEPQPAAVNEHKYNTVYRFKILSVLRFSVSLKMSDSLSPHY